MKLPIAVFLSVALALNCGDATPTGAGSSRGVAPTLVAAVRDSARIVHVTVDWRNVGSVPVYLSACDGHASMWLERRGATGWEGFGGGICMANLDGTPVRLGASESVRATVGVGPGEEGEYRAVISTSDDLGGEWRIVRSAPIPVQ